jgi:hypothetical protein
LQARGNRLEMFRLAFFHVPTRFTLY